MMKDNGHKRRNKNKKKVKKVIERDVHELNMPFSAMKV